MTSRQNVETAPFKINELIDKLFATSNRAVKARRILSAELIEELARFIDNDEQRLVPLFRRHSGTKKLAAESININKELHERTAKLAEEPKDDDAFLDQLAELNRVFQQHIRDETTQISPTMLMELIDEGGA